MIIPGENVQIQASSIEYREGGNTLYVHGLEGATILRIKCKSITTNVGCENICSHADVYAPELKIEFCRPESEDNSSSANLMNVAAFKALIEMLQNDLQMSYREAVIFATQKVQEERSKMHKRDKEVE